MPVIGVTGGIATGKTTFTNALLRRLPAERFDADGAVHSLLADDPLIHKAVETTFGQSVFHEDGKPDRARLRDLVFADEANRRKLEAILHPAVRERWIALADDARRVNSWLVVDIPLLYETGSEVHCDRVVVVACSADTQFHRLQSERRLDAEMARRIISAQLHLESKINRADHLIWTDSTVACLDSQAHFLSTWLTHHYG